MRAVRIHLGRSQDVIGRHMDCTRQHLSAFENGHALPIPDTWRRWLEAVDAAMVAGEGSNPAWIDELLQRAKRLYAQASGAVVGSLEVEDPGVRRDTFLKLSAAATAAAAGGLVSTDDQVGDSEITQAVAEARASAAALAPVATTTATLDKLDRAVRALDTVWVNQPLPQVFRRARSLRNQITTFLDGRMTQHDRLHLITLGAIVHAHLADALLDLGYFTAAWSQTSTGLRMARVVNAGECQVILHSQRSRIRYWQGNYDVALTEAQAGEACARPGSAAAVKLYDKLAIAASRTGDAPEARRALHAGQAARDAAGTASYLAPTGEAFCAMSAAGTLEVLGDLAAARRQAEHAIRHYTARGSTSVNLTFAQIALAKAQPDPAAAALLGAQAIEAYLAGPRRSQTIVVTTRQLDAMLPDGLAEVEDFRDRLHVLEASTRHVIPGV